MNACTTVVAGGIDTAYLRQQEAILTSLLHQIGPGHARVRLLLQLRHTQNCLALAIDCCPTS